MVVLALNFELPDDAYGRQFARARRDEMTVKQHRQSRKNMSRIVNTDLKKANRTKSANR